MTQMKRLGVPSTEVVDWGRAFGYNYMVMPWIDGSHGANLPEKDWPSIWFQLGTYAREYQ